MPFRDSVDKIVTTYFAAVCAEPFTYNGTRFEVPHLIVTPNTVRGYTCPEGCGGCCPRFSLDYIPGEPQPYYLASRFVVFNDMEVAIYTDPQTESTDHHCANLNHSNGRCGIHGSHPFSCDFELLRFLHFSDDNKFRLMTKLYGRGHAFLRVDGERGALCKITPRDEAVTQDVVRKLKRLAQWCEYFGLQHRLDRIVQWAQSNPTAPLVLPKPNREPQGLFKP